MKEVPNNAWVNWYPRFWGSEPPCSFTRWFHSRTICTISRLISFHSGATFLFNRSCSSCNYDSAQCSCGCTCTFHSHHKTVKGLRLRTPNWSKLLANDDWEMVEKQHSKQQRKRLSRARRFTCGPAFGRCEGEIQEDGGNRGDNPCWGDDENPSIASFATTRWPTSGRGLPASN